MLRADTVRERACEEDATQAMALAACKLTPHSRTYIHDRNFLPRQVLVVGHFSFVVCDSVK